VDGHISVLDVLTVEHNELNQPADGKVRLVQSLCLDLLVTLCGTTRTTRMAIVNAEQCDRLLSVASENICSLARKLKGESIVSDDPTDTEDNEQEEEVPCPEATESDPDKESAAEEKKSSAENEVVTNCSLEVSALSLLIELVPAKSCRKMFLDNSVLLQACSLLAGQSQFLEIQYVSVRFLSNLAPFLRKDGNEGEFSVSSLASIFCEILAVAASPEQNSRLDAVGLAAKKKTITDKQMNCNMVLAAAVSGIESIFTTILPLVKTEIISKLSSLFIRIVDDFSGKPKWGGRRAKLEENSAFLACSISSLFVLIIGSEISSDSIQEPELFSAMVRLIMAVRDVEAKSEVQGASEFKDKELWYAVQTHCLLCVSSVARRMVSDDDAGFEEVMKKS